MLVSPQPTMEPSAFRAIEKFSPPPSCTKSLPLGVFETTPELLRPHETMEPSDLNASECHTPAATCAKLFPPGVPVTWP